jgi:hypothetical protein
MTRKSVVGGLQAQRVSLYRDAGNYKFRGEFNIKGPLSIEELRPHLIDGEYFVPQQIGVLSLIPQVRNDDDHMLHEFWQIEPGEAAPYLFTSQELIARLRPANRRGWFSGMY